MGITRIEGYTRVARIRHSRFQDDIPEVKARIKSAGLRYASPNILRGESPVDNCVYDNSTLVNITPDGTQRRCETCSKTYHFTGNSR
jgi:hypothetical protein